MRVLHIMSGDLWGGSEAQMELQLAALSKAGVEILVLVFNTGETSARLKQSGILVCCCEESRGFAALLRGAAERATEFGPDLIVSHGYKEAAIGALLSFKTRRPLVTTFHGAPEIFRGSAAVRSRLYSWCHYVIARLTAGRIITVSDALAAELGFARLEKQRTVRNVVQIKEPLGSAALNKPAIAVVGRLVKVKRVELALAAFSELSRENASANLYIVGDGPERGELEALASRLGPKQRVHFLGFRPDAQQIICGADVLLISSVREGIPSVLLEALALGKKIVSVELAGIREVAERIGGHSIEFSGEEPAELAAALEKALAAGIPAPEDLKEFSPEAAAARHLEIYREIASTSAAP